MLKKITDRVYERIWVCSGEQYSRSHGECTRQKSSQGSDILQLVVSYPVNFKNSFYAENTHLILGVVLLDSPREG